MRLSRDDLLNLCEIYKAKALEEHELFRKWQARAIEAETRLAIYEPGDGDAGATSNISLQPEDANRPPVPEASRPSPLLSYLASGALTAAHTGVKPQVRGLGLDNASRGIL